MKGSARQTIIKIWNEPDFPLVIHRIPGWIHSECIDNDMLPNVEKWVNWSAVSMLRHHPHQERPNIVLKDGLICSMQFVESDGFAHRSASWINYMLKPLLTFNSFSPPFSFKTLYKLTTLEGLTFLLLCRIDAAFMCSSLERSNRIHHHYIQNTNQNNNHCQLKQAIGKNTNRHHSFIKLLKIALLPCIFWRRLSIIVTTNKWIHSRFICVHVVLIGVIWVVDSIWVE